MLNYIKKRHLVFFVLLSALAIGSFIYLQDDSSKETAHIRPYDQEKDFKPLVKLMHDNMFWVSETSNFSPEKMLLTRAPSYAPHKKGLAIIDVVEDSETTAGFIAYYKKDSTEGYIWLLAVDKAFRGRGLAEKLARHALVSLKKQGAKYVTLGTRLINTPALALYKKLGFVEQDRDEKRGMITLIKKSL